MFPTVKTKPLISHSQISSQSRQGGKSIFLINQSHSFPFKTEIEFLNYRGKGAIFSIFLLFFSRPYKNDSK